MVDALEIRVLGPFEVSTGGRPVAVTGGKRDALLALLALRQGRVVTVDELVGALWGEDLPAAPRNAVQHHVARLRASLGHEAIVAAPDGYALAAARVDALQFEELLGEGRAALREGDARAAAASIASALALCRGPSLQGLTDLASFSGEARRLEGLRVDALEEQFEAALALGEHREILSQLRETLEENPFRERLWGQLMLALYRSGRQADALEAFQEARSVLAEELGLEPGLDLKRLQEAILAQDPAIAAVPLPPRHGNLPSPTTSFVGREEEVATILELLRGQRLVTLTGPPGVGKSRLALEAARALEEQVADGAWLIEVVHAGDASTVVRLLAQAVDARGPDPLARVLARLRDADALIILDACEHAVEEAAQLSSTLLAECRHVRVLATSREALHLVGEVRVSVEPLPVGDLDEAADSPAVQLFAARARAARPNFQLTQDTASLVADIARRVGRAAAGDRARRRPRQRARPRGAPLRSSSAASRCSRDGIGPEPSSQRSARPRRMELRASALATRRRYCTSLPCTAALSLSVAARRRCDPRARRGDGHLPASSTGRQIDRPGVVPSRARRATTCSTPSASTHSRSWSKAAASPLPARHTRSTSRRWPTARDRLARVADGSGG